MPQFFLNKRLIILLISIILLVALIGYSLRDRENVSKPEQFVRDIVGFGQSIVAFPAHGISNFIDSVKDIQNTYTENKKLKARLDELPKITGEIADLKSENEELKKILKKQDDLRNYSSIQATIVSRNSDQWYENITISKGSSSGVKKNMAIMTSKGLLGKVISTSPSYSTVELLSSSNPKNRISAEVLSKKKEYGLIQGYDEEHKVLLLKTIDYDVSVKKGDIVNTSGLGGVFPKGLPIGTVEKLVPDENGLTQTAWVKPYADFYDIENVQIIERTTVNPDEEGE
ncbi:rod shape-determining protein MreC [Heyndrickxia vini]|uniref:Cell shape-determining protein MreC n=1 Tax=Heyndrickxia vini TaxID=1476025 RepID=A0ABX7E4R6_9BACI|nr:rod shape-determining protein MreC [Heyndrickxia vini]QQZ10718.1 rod shape-determining protein MreC [Heyndrickxia vini]